jgi:DNA (cytosine-5)-methyltransferase 1
MRILNLYAGIGGNRKLWGDEHEVVAVENVPEIAAIYKDLFPNDKVIIADAHKYLLEHFEEFDFIWSSPPCPSHSRMRLLRAEKGDMVKYPDMKLYEEIILLKFWFEGDWVVENVVSYYEPLIKPFVIDNHYFWSNRLLSGKKHDFRGIIRLGEIESINHKEVKFGFDLSKYGVSNRFKRNVLNNCVAPLTGLNVFNQIFKDKQKILLDVV